MKSFGGVFKLGSARPSKEFLNDHKEMKWHKMIESGITDEEKDRRMGQILEGLCKNLSVGSLHHLGDHWGVAVDFEFEGNHTIITGYSCYSYQTTTTFKDSDLTWVYFWSHKALRLEIEKSDPCGCYKCDECEEQRYLCDKCHKKVDPDWSP